MIILWEDIDINILEAAAEVLKDYKDGLHYRDLTHQIIQRGLWESLGKTPERTLRAEISKHLQQQGDEACFRRESRGIIHYGKPAKVKCSPMPLVKKKKWLSFTDAAEKVLTDYCPKSPMHYRAITDKALELGLISTSGQTPAATMYAQMLMEMERRKKRGEKNRFEKHGKGLLSLITLSDPGLATQIEDHNDGVRRKLHDKLRKIPPFAFEFLVGQLLSTLGFESVEVTRYGADGGIDVRGVMVVGDVIRTRMAVQAKRLKDNVQSPTVQQVRGSLGAHEQGLIITISDFSSGARQEAERPDATPVALMNGKQLVNLLIENNIGIHRANYDLLELLDDESFIPQ